MQAALDLQSGILHAADERDFKTAYSYFYEAFEGYDSIAESTRALTALKYMLLCKIMLGLADDVNQIVSGKMAITYSGRDIDAMKAVAQASHKRSLADFEIATKEYEKELEHDVIVKAHLGTLYDTMMEQNLCRIIEPFSRVQVSIFFFVVFLKHSTMSAISILMNFFFQFSRFHILPIQLNCRYYKWKRNYHK